jgi:hypothetical protein
MYKDH